MPKRIDDMDKRRVMSFRLKPETIQLLKLEMMAGFYENQSAFLDEVINVYYTIHREEIEQFKRDHPNEVEKMTSDLKESQFDYAQNDRAKRSKEKKLRASKKK